MLSIAGPFKGTQASLEYYIRYYTEQMKGVGRWFGKGAELLGLGIRVTASQLRSLFRGFHPEGIPLVQNAGREDRQAFWDLTFSAPKSVSMLWAMLPEKWRAVIEEAQLNASKQALTFLEEEAGLSRRGKGGCVLEKAGFTIALFLDYTSRELDPQLHTHCVLVNIGTRDDGTTGALWTDKMFFLKMEAGALYRVALANELSRLLGVRIEPDRFGFCLSDVPKNVCEEFSKRRKQIEAELERRGDFSAVAAKDAAIRTRGPSKKADLDLLFEAWEKVGRELGWDRSKAEATLNRDEKRKEPEQKLLPDQEKEKCSKMEQETFEQSQTNKKAKSKETFSKMEQESSEQSQTNKKAKSKKGGKKSSRKEREAYEKKVEEAESEAIKHRHTGKAFREALTSLASQFFHIRHWRLREQTGPRIITTVYPKSHFKYEKVVRAKTVLKLPYIALGPIPPFWNAPYKTYHPGSYSEFRIQKHFFFPKAPFSQLRQLGLPAIRWHFYDATERLRASRARKKLREQNKILKEQRRKFEREAAKERDRQREEQKRREEEERRRQEQQHARSR